MSITIFDDYELYLNMTKEQADSLPLRFSKILKLGESGSTPTYEDIVLTGTGSVTLTNAKTNGINYVKAFGGCAQTQSPNLITNLQADGGSGISIAIMNDNSIRINGSRTSSTGYSVSSSLAITLPAGTYTLAVYDKPEGDYTGTQLQITYSGSSTIRHYVDMSGTSTTFTLDASKNILFKVYVTANTTYNNYIIKPMLVAGSTAPATYTPALPCKDWNTPIKCNNGDLKMVDDELPTGYKRVLGYTCNNDTLWQITGFHLRGSDTVRISFSVTGACNVFGCYQGADATDNYDLYVSTTSNSKYFRYGNGTYLSYWASANLGQRFDVVYTPTGSTGMPQDSTWTPMTFESANDLLLGATTLTGTSSKLKGDLYGNFVVDGRLKLIPCERISDNVLGYYDTYSETFFEPTGTPTSLGYDGSHYVFAIDGTTETISVKDNSNTVISTATATDLLGLGTTQDVQNITTGEIIRNIGYHIFDGTETLATASFSSRYAVKVTSSSWGADGTEIPMCNYFRGTGYNAEGYNTCFWESGGRTSYFYIKTNLNNVDNFRAWLVDMYNQGTPMIVAFKKATATTERATPQTLTTKSGNNTIEITQASINNLPLEVSYKGIQEQQGE